MVLFFLFEFGLVALFIALVIYMISMFLRPSKNNTEAPGEETNGEPAESPEGEIISEEQPGWSERIGEKMGDFARTLALLIVVPPIVVFIVVFLLTNLIKFTNSIFPAP